MVYGKISDPRAPRVRHLISNLDDEKPALTGTGHKDIMMRMRMRMRISIAAAFGIIERSSSIQLSTKPHHEDIRQRFNGFVSVGVPTEYGEIDTSSPSKLAS